MIVVTVYSLNVRYKSLTINSNKDSRNNNNSRVLLKVIIPIEQGYKCWSLASWCHTSEYQTCIFLDAATAENMVDIFLRTYPTRGHPETPVEAQHISLFNEAELITAVCSSKNGTASSPSCVTEVILNGAARICLIFCCGCSMPT